MADRRIKNELSTDYQLVGIASSLKEYKLCFHLNHILNCDFRKLKDLVFEPTDRTRQVQFSVFKAKSEDGLNTFLVFTNKNGGEVLLPEVSNFDYILQVEGKFEAGQLKTLTEEIRQVPQVIMTTKIPLNKVRNRERLVYEEERPVRKLITTKKV